MARFRCRTSGTATFSMLPVQLAPYCQYTLESMIRTLLLVLTVLEEEQRGILAALGEVPGDHDVTVGLLAYWRGLVLRGLRRAHPFLHPRYDLSSVRSAEDHHGQLLELRAYCDAFRSRGPPGLAASLGLTARFYGYRTRRHLMGTPSQER